MGPNWRSYVGYLVVMLVILWVWQEMAGNITVRTIPYSEFKHLVAEGRVSDCEIRQDEIRGQVVAMSAAKPARTATTAPVGRVASGPEATTSHPAKPASQPAESEAFAFRTVRVEDPKLVEDLEAGRAKFVGVRPGFLSQFLWAWVLPIGGLMLLWVVLSKRIGLAGQGVMSFGKSKARLIADKDTGVTFADVAGCEEAKTDLQEIVEFLKAPQRFRALGAAIPKGALLIGPPGTGKTLLARAVAGEAHVSFFSMSGSDFVEMFVGVGASRVRDLFLQAKTHAPCIIFIDEIDAVGRQRGVPMGMVNDEREQTLNQLLAEMDGFEANTGVIILAATNRPEVLDRALLRPGRFDRQILVDAPDVDGREAILRVHARGKQVAAKVDLRVIAQETPGFSGADLANTLNEAALLAARRGAAEIIQRDIEAAVERVVAGPERKSRRLNAEDRRRVAYHEVGHALVAAFSHHADQVHKISIVPRGRAALGYTLQLPDGDKFLMTRSELDDRIKGLLGGRAAEEVVFNEVSTGAENDLEMATTLARQMVCMYGMGTSAGLMHCGHHREPVFLGVPGTQPQQECSDETTRQIDQEVKAALETAYQQARALLVARREDLERIAGELLTRETLDRQAFERLLQPSGLAGCCRTIDTVPANPEIHDTRQDTLEDRAEATHRRSGGSS